MELNETEEIISYIQTNTFDQIIAGNSTMSDVSDLAKVKSALWQKYLNCVNGDTQRKQQHDMGELTGTENCSMKFYMKKFGTKPEDGYPLYIALHGGGNCAASVNDSQWIDMQTYYAKQVTVSGKEYTDIETGIYVAPRGITNTWNLHFVNASYYFYDLMIENMITYEGVNPNKVYLLGFSAGGDGVYQITPRMPDRWTAVNMSAGCPNGINPQNLSNVAFFMQMGDLDSEYNRNTDSAQFLQQLNTLQNANPNEYMHNLFLHYNGTHNSWCDNDPLRKEYEIVQYPLLWLNSYQTGQPDTQPYKLANTNAVDWIKQYYRNPLPAHFNWDLETRTADSRNQAIGTAYAGTAGNLLSAPKNLCYWLDINQSTNPTGSIHIRYSFNPTENRNQIYLDEPLSEGTSLRILLHENLFNLRVPTQIIYNNTTKEISPGVNLSVMARTLLERGDLNYCFCSEINI